MLTSQKVIDAINEQIGYEFSASLQYYAIARAFRGGGVAATFAAFFPTGRGRKGPCAAVYQIRGRRRRARSDPGNRCAKIKIQDYREMR